MTCKISGGVMVHESRCTMESRRLDEPRSDHGWNFPRPVAQKTQLRFLKMKAGKSPIPDDIVIINPLAEPR